MVVIFFVVFLRTNNVSQQGNETSSDLAGSNVLSVNTGTLVAFNRKPYPKKIILYSLYYRLISQF